LGSGPHSPDAPRPYLTVPFVPHIDLWEPCHFTDVSDGPQTYTLNPYPANVANTVSS